MPNIILNHEQIAINTIYCIGRSYGEHIRELNNEVPDEPLVFLKPNSSIVMGDVIKLPDFSDDVHHEVELVLLIGDDKQIIGSAVGIDFTARDVQTVCKNKGLPWTKAKGFKNACWLGAFSPFENRPYKLSLAVGGSVRQEDSTAKMMYGFHELVAHLDMLYGIQKGDLVMTGTPKGVGRLVSGDRLTVGLDDSEYTLTIA